MDTENDADKQDLADPRFYVVGGTVQPGRDCYVARSADAELFERLADGEYCYVLAQRQVGKSSLAAATAARLRALDRLAAVVDLTQTSAEDPTENTGRWYYSIAYRICRDLRVRADLQSWWAERGGLTNLQRLREFFQEIVLTETDRPVAVFFDRVEATLDAPLAQDLFACVRACYDARATNPEFARLTFTLLSSAAPRELVKSVQGSPFEIATGVPLPDFSPQEMAALLAGLGPAPALAEEINARVWSWTHGHPYLSQKLYRALARRADDELAPADVDKLMRTQFLAPHTLREEPHLSVIAAALLRETPTRTARLNLYGAVSKGIRVRSAPESVAEQELTVLGLVVPAADGFLRVRNEIYARVFSTRWVNNNLPFGARRLAAGAVGLACIIALPIWYAEYLPQPYVAALTAVDQDAQVAAEAFTSLQRLPGFGRTAERLYTTYLVRNGERAAGLEAVQSVTARLRELPGGVELAAELLASHWDRVTSERMHSGDRDGALLAAVEALERPTPLRRRQAGELVGSDYANLRGTLRGAAAVSDLAADTDNALVTLLDADNAIDRWSLESPRPTFLRRIAIAAEERLPLELRRYYEGLPPRPRLLLALRHAAPEQLEVGLRAPSGQQATVALTRGVALGNVTYAFDLGRYPELRNLLAGTEQGSWTLLVTDVAAGTAGEVLAWDLVAGGATLLRDTAAVDQPIPEPRQIEAARVRLGAAGRLALAWPQQVLSAGVVQVWDLSTDAVVARVPHSAALRDAKFALGGRLVLTLDGPMLRVWDTANGVSLGEIPFAGADFSELAVALNGRFAAWGLAAAEATEQPVIVVWDLLGMQEMGRVVAAGEMVALAVDAAGQQLAQGGRDNFVRVWSVADAQLQNEYVLSAPARALHFDISGQWLAADDLSNTLRLWDLQGAAVPVVERAGNSRWQIGFAADSPALIYGSYERAYQIVYLPDGRRAAADLRHPALPGLPRPEQRPPALLLEQRDLAMTAAAGAGVKVWRLPPPIALPLRQARIDRGLLTALSPDGQRIAAGTVLQDLRIHRAAAPGSLALVPPPAAGTDAEQIEITQLRFGAQQNWLAAAATDGQVRVWDTDSSLQVVAPIVHADGPALVVVFVAADRYLVSASRLEVQVTDMQTGSTVGRLRIQADNPDIAYAAGSGQLFINDGPRGVVRWNWRTDISMPVVPASYQVERLAVTADGQRLITAGADLQLRQWDAQSGELLPQIIQAAGEVDGLWLAASERRLVVQAGHWLHTATLAPTGLQHGYTRLLQNVPTALQPLASGAAAYMVLPANGDDRPAVRSVALAEPQADELPGDAGTLRDYWRPRLALDVTPAGEIVQVRPAFDAD